MKLLHRQLHVGSIFELSNSKGVRTGGTFNFFRSLSLEMRNHPNYYPVICFDAGLAKRRLDIFPNYKHTLDKKADAEAHQILVELGQAEPEDDEYLNEYRHQRSDIMRVADKLGIPCLKYNGWEGDDLMKICSMMASESIVLSDDRDMIQLLAPNIKISRPMAGQLLEYNEYQAEHNDPDMTKFIIAKSIVGDGSDNIPQCCRGVGGKTAEKIAEMIVNNPDGWKDELANSSRKSWRAFIGEESLKQLEINKQLIDLRLVETTPELQESIIRTLTSSVKSPDYMGVRGILAELEIEKLDVDSMILNIMRTQPNFWNN